MAVAAAVEAVALLLAGGRIERGDATEVGEGALVVEPLGVVTGGDEKRSCRLGANAV